MVLKPTILTKVDKNLQKITKLIEDKDISGTETEKEILRYIANIIKVDTLETNSNYNSPILEKLIEKNKQKIIDLAQNKIVNYKTPSFILNFNQTIDFNVQERVYDHIKKVKRSILPREIKYNECLKALENFHKLYS